MWSRTGKRGQHELIFRPNSSTSLSTTPKGNRFDESGTNAELPYFDLSTIVAATENFSFANKLGEGGFGTVYKVK